MLYSNILRKPAKKEYGENVDKIKWQNLYQASHTSHIVIGVPSRRKPDESLFRGGARSSNC
jgi:hypothetical protein